MTVEEQRPQEERPLYEDQHMEIRTDGEFTTATVTTPMEDTDEKKAQKEFEQTMREIDEDLKHVKFKPMHVGSACKTLCQSMKMSPEEWTAEFSSINTKNGKIINERRGITINFHETVMVFLNIILELLGIVPLTFHLKEPYKDSFGFFDNIRLSKALTALKEHKLHEATFGDND